MQERPFSGRQSEIRPQPFIKPDWCAKARQAGTASHMITFEERGPTRSRVLSDDGGNRVVGRCKLKCCPFKIRTIGTALLHARKSLPESSDAGTQLLRADYLRLFVSCKVCER